MLNPQRHLRISILVSFGLALALSISYYYRAITDLHTDRLHTDLAISHTMPIAIYSDPRVQQPINARDPTDPASQTEELALQLNLSGLKLLAFRLQNLNQQTLLQYRSFVPFDHTAATVTGFKQAREGTANTYLESSGWFSNGDEGLYGRHILVSQIPLRQPGTQEVRAILQLASDQSSRVKAIYLTLLSTLLLTFSCLATLNLYLHKVLKKGKKQVDNRLAENAKVAHKASHDTLTGLPNRTTLMQRLNQAIERSGQNRQSVAVMFLDLDGFKEVNDTLGHHIGDQLLKNIAKRLSECVREGDTAARLGGDEFVLIFPLFDSRYTEKSSEVAQRVLASLSTPMSLRGREVKLGCSIGVSLYPDDGKDADTLLKNADSAMYQAKAHGRNNVQYFSPLLSGMSAPPSNPANAIKQALKRQEFHLLYQPQIDLKSDAIAGMSAQLRWLRPGLGMVDAEKILPISQKDKPSLPVGAWLLKTACQQRMNWQKKGIHCGPLTVHLSDKLFQFDSLPTMITDLLTSSHLHPKNLTLDITDCLKGQQSDTIHPVLEKLKALGIGLCVDASELSSNTLRGLPLDALRIPPGIISKAMSSSVDSIVARSIIALGHQLQLPVIAEGVDNHKLQEYLYSKGCTQIQGPYIKAPVTSHEAAEWVVEYIYRHSRNTALKTGSEI